MFSTRVIEIQNRIQNKTDRGALLIEFAALLTLVVVVAIMALAAFGGSVLDLYTSNSERFADAAQRNVG